MSSLLITARWVAPVSSPPIEGGWVAVEDGRIAAVDSRKPDLCGDVVDLGDAVVLPGLINAHTHLEFSILEKPLGPPGQSLPNWIRRVIAERKRGGSSCSAISAGIEQCLLGGVTTIADIATEPASSYRTQGGFKAPVVLLHEAIGFSAARSDSAFRDVERRLDAANSFLSGVSPHAPYTVSPQLVERLATLASQRRLPLAMHLAESLEELEFLATGGGPFRELLEERSMYDQTVIPLGARPLNYLQLLGANLQSRSLVVHGNYLASDEMSFIAEHRDRMTVVYCPRTHAYFRHREHPLRDLLAAGARVVIGTDSLASNPNLNLAAEVGYAAAQFPDVAPEAWVRMVTADSAYALGLEDNRGDLSAGKRADIVAFPRDAAAPAAEDPYESVLRDDAKPIAVWLAGERAV